MLDALSSLVNHEKNNSAVTLLVKQWRCEAGANRGATENAGVENAILAKLQEWKMQQWKIQE